MNKEELLQQYYGYSSFRPGQQTAIDSILNRHDALCIMPTGSGKSICYQIPALILKGLTLVISPLISLMKDQVNALSQQNIPAAYLNSSLTSEEFADTLFQASCGMYRILYIAPERLTVPSFTQLCQHLVIPFVAVDEAHCISQWGQDFRPAYLKIKDFIDSLPVRPIIGAYTATATDQVSRDIVHLLELRDPIRVTTGFDRPNLSFTVLEPANTDRELTRILQKRTDQSGIIYCPTRKRVEEICEKLQHDGFSATRYHAKLDLDERRQNQEDFLFDRKHIMVATNAFGMGIDKSNVSYIIHCGIPLSLEAYYQEAGRAGRDGSPADCILLYNPSDFYTCKWLIEHAEPNPDLSPEEQKEVMEKQQERLKRMMFYAHSRKCLRQNILRYFGEQAPGYCGNCSVCAGDVEHTDITTDAKKILSCVIRGKEILPANLITDILLGTNPAKEYQHLSTFGIMKDMSRENILAEIKELIHLGYLDADAPINPVLKATPASKEVLFGNRRLAMRRSDLRNKHVQKKDVPVNPDLLNALRYLRLKLSSMEKVAPFVILSDATLMDLCRKMPSTPDELLYVNGIGTFKSRKYGQQILEALNLYRSKTK